MLSESTLAHLQQLITDAKVDGWLLYDFHGANPISLGVVGLEGMLTRRWFVWVPKQGEPVAITHAIEQGPWRNWPSAWKKEVYSGWRSLEQSLAKVKGKTVAMEYSAGDASPYLDRVPAGVIELVRAAGANVVTSADLVSRFYAVWTAEQLASHMRAAEMIAIIGKEALTYAGRQARQGTEVAEYGLQQWITDRFTRLGMEFDHPPIVAVGPNAADPHYEPSRERPFTIKGGDLVLIDLWAREKGGIYADQTWMGCVGDPTDEMQKVWRAVRDGRDAAIDLIRTRIRAHQPIMGGEADDAARNVITKAGYGPQFTHRTGHSIDAHSLHGAGPHIDNLETREERLLLPGVAFSIEPGVYLTGNIGFRTEVNVVVQENDIIVTPKEIQREIQIV